MLPTKKALLFAYLLDYRDYKHYISLVSGFLLGQLLEKFMALA